MNKFANIKSLIEDTYQEEISRKFEVSGVAKKETGIHQMSEKVVEEDEDQDTASLSTVGRDCSESDT